MQWVCLWKAIKNRSVLLLKTSKFYNNSYYKILNNNKYNTMSVNKFTKGLSADEKAEIQEKFIEVSWVSKLIKEFAFVMHDSMQLNNWWVEFLYKKPGNIYKQCQSICRWLTYSLTMPPNGNKNNKNSNNSNYLAVRVSQLGMEVVVVTKGKGCLVAFIIFVAVFAILEESSHFHF